MKPPPHIRRAKHHQNKTAHHQQQVPHPKPSQTHALLDVPNSFKGLRSKLHVPARSSRIHPGDDFYRACNEAWLQKTHIPEFRDSYSVSEELEDYLETYLFEIANRATQKAKSGLKPEEPCEDAIGRLVLSAMRPEKQKESVEYLKRGMRGLACIRSREDVGATLGRMIRNGVPTLLDIGADLFLQDGEPKYRLMISPGSLGLPDPRYYIQIESPGGSVLKPYKELLDFVAKEFDLGLDLASGISTETSLAEPLQKFQEEREFVIRPLAEFQKEFHAIPWNSLLGPGGLGIPEKILRTAGSLRIAVTAAGWLSVLNSFFESLPVEQWSPLLGIHTAVHGIQYLPSPYDQRHFELFGKTLQGQKSKIPQHVLTMNVLKDLMSDSMSYLFVKKYITAKEKERAETFVRSILSAAKDRLSENPWMESATKRRTRAKVDAMVASVFYPEPTKPPTALPALQTDNFLVNVYLLSSARMDRDIGRLASNVRSIENAWDEPAYTANAFYYQDLNQIVLPAGYFYWPFYDSERLGWSYGGLGTIISHEIIHAFDEEGKDIDAKGEQQPLWSKGDERKYQERLGEIIRLFNQAKVGDIFVNGKKTASENLADLGGLAISLDALEHLLRAKKVGAQERLRELRDFFWSYAVSWRTRVRDKRAIQSIYMDRHAPPEFRVNYIVPQFDAWYEAFGVQTEHDLYIPPEERIRVF